jgi:hypothetical protein
MQKTEIGFSPHARPQALDKASYPLNPDFWKGLGAMHVGLSGHASQYGLLAINRYRGNAAGRDRVKTGSTAPAKLMIRGASCA